MKKKTKAGFRKELVKQMVALSTAGFGLVAAFAWNEAIQSFVKQYIDKYVSVGSSIISRFIYAIVITAIAVLITYELSRILLSEEDKDDD